MDEINASTESALNRTIYGHFIALNLPRNFDQREEMNWHYKGYQVKNFWGNHDLKVQSFLRMLESTPMPKNEEKFKKFSGEMSNIYSMVCQLYYGNGEEYCVESSYLPAVTIYSTVGLKQLDPISRHPTQPDRIKIRGFLKYTRYCNDFMEGKDKCKYYKAFISSDNKNFKKMCDECPKAKPYVIDHVSFIKESKRLELVSFSVKKLDQAIALGIATLRGSDINADIRLRPSKYDGDYQGVEFIPQEHIIMDDKNERKQDILP